MIQSHQSEVIILSLRSICFMACFVCFTAFKLLFILLCTNSFLSVLFRLISCLLVILAFKYEVFLPCESIITSIFKVSTGVISKSSAITSVLVYVFVSVLVESTTDISLFNVVSVLLLFTLRVPQLTNNNIIRIVIIFFIVLKNMC